MEQHAIDLERLQEFIDAFVIHEIANHGVDPRIQVEGTTLRIANSEGYKYKVIDTWNQLLDSCRKDKCSYFDAIIKIMAGCNLVEFHQRDRLKTIKEEQKENTEQVLSRLFNTSEDETAFNNIVRLLGGSFDVVSFLFFLKDCDTYSPVRSSIFDHLFTFLGIESNLAGHCTWEKYKQYNGWITEVQDFLSKHLNRLITRIDSHSFVWILDGINKNINSEALVVEHEKHGRGVIVNGLDQKYIKVRFGNALREFERDAFQTGFLKFIPSKMDIYGRLLDVIPVDPDSKKINYDEDEKLVSDTREFSIADENHFSYNNVAVERPAPVMIKGKTLYPRNRQTAINALKHASYRCEMNPTDKTFIRKKSEIPYTEPHHLVPLAFQEQFSASLDREQNIVSLCSNCHNEIHYGKDAGRIVAKLYEDRKMLLQSIGINITLEQLLKMYDA